MSKTLFDSSYTLKLELIFLAAECVSPRTDKTIYKIVDI